MLFHGMLFSTITNSLQKIWVNSNFSTWENILVPQDSILGLLLFNFCINDLFLFVSNSRLSNYANDNTSYASGYNLEEIKNILHFDFGLVSKRFEENFMALNADKCHFVHASLRIREMKHLSLIFYH